MNNNYRKLTAISIVVFLIIFSFGCSNPATSDDENSITHYLKTEPYSKVTNGAHIILTYESSTWTFTGTVTNESGDILKNVSIEIHLSNGITLGPNKLNDIDPNMKINIKFIAPDDDFITWAVIFEVG